MGEQFTPQNIGCALVISVVLFYAIRGFWAWCDRVDNEWAERNPPDQDEIAAEHVAKVQRKRNFPQQHYYRYADGVETEGGCYE